MPLPAAPGCRRGDQVCRRVARFHRRVARFYRPVDTFYRRVDTFYRRVDTIYRRFARFHRRVTKFYRRFARFHRRCARFYRRVDTFYRRFGAQGPLDQALKAMVMDDGSKAEAYRKAAIVAALTCKDLTPLDRRRVAQANGPFDSNTGCPHLIDTGV